MLEVVGSGGECNHRCGIFGTAVSSFLRESVLALNEARSDPRRCKIPTPESYCHIGDKRADLDSDLGLKVEAVLIAVFRHESRSRPMN